MSSVFVIGLDGESSGERALAFGKRMARLIEGSEIVVTYVIEWSPFSFQTAEENAARHKRREEEIAQAQERVVDPAVAALQAEGLNARGVVRHGDVANTLNSIAVEENADQIIIARSGEDGFASRLFGGSTAKLVMSASVPVTVIQ